MSNSHLTIIYAKNPVDRNTWTRHENVKNLECFLLDTVAKDYGGHFPTTGRIYVDEIDQEHDITPVTEQAAEELSKVRGTVYVVVWPSGQAIAMQLVVSAGIFLATTLLKKMIDLPDEKVTSRNIPKGSPNNLPGQRQNTARVLQRIPDIYGTVKATPDLIQVPYIEYENNLQVETVAAIIGRGEFDINEDDIKEGSTPVNQIQGASLAVYPPFEVPVYGTPQLQIGAPIEDPLLTVIQVKEVTGQNILAPNNTFIFGDDDEHDEEYSDSNDAALFEYPSTGVGRITFFYATHARAKSDGAFYFTNRLNVGDKFGLDWIGDSSGLEPITDIPDVMRARGGISITRSGLTMGSGGDANIPDLRLLPETTDDDHYEVTGLSVDEGLKKVIYTITVPVSVRPEWEKLILFNPDAPLAFNFAPAGGAFNRTCLIYLLNYAIGPFFCNDPNMEQVHLNFIAERGLWIDDGRRQRAYGAAAGGPIQASGGVEIVVELTPADENGIANGPKELHEVTLYGSSVKRDFIGITAKVTPSFQGRFLIAVRRNTLHYWRTMSSAFFIDNNAGDENNWSEDVHFLFNTPSVPYPHSLDYADDIKWTHCYSISEPKYYPFTDPVENFGFVTIVHSRTSQQRFVSLRELEKNLNMIVTRVQPVFSGDDFIGNFPTSSGKDAALYVLNDNRIAGAVNDSEIDYFGIQQAFSDVQAAFGNDSTSIQFSHTFDNDQSSFEDILSAIGESCFVIFYRQGNIIRAKADISQIDSALLFNHRNMLPGSESRTIAFGTEEDYDGVEVEFTDNLDNQVKSYIAPITISPPLNMQKIRVAGVRTREKAAMHAWRAANRLLYQKVVTEFDACEEAALSLVKDKVLVANTTAPDVMDGDIVRIDGLTVYTSQEINVSPGQPYTLFIQDIDGTVQAIPVVSEDTTNSLILDGAPSASLVINEAAGIFPRYFLVRDRSSLSSAFQIRESAFKNLGVYSIVASNYSEGYFFNDALRLWLPFKGYTMFPPITRFMDRSPNEFDEAAVGSPTTVQDTDRGQVYVGNGSSKLEYTDSGLAGGTSYTVAVWLKLDTLGGTVVGAMSPNGELVVAIDGTTGAVEVFHEGVQVSGSSEVVVDEWQHVAVTYDDDTEILLTYLNGEQDGIAIDVQTFNAVLGLEVLDIDGRGDDLRVYNVCKSPEFIRELYQRTRK